MDKAVASKEPYIHWSGSIPFVIYRNVYYSFKFGEWQACLKGPDSTGFGYMLVESKELRMKLSEALENALRESRKEVAKYSHAIERLDKCMKDARVMLSAGEHIIP